jgi:cobalt/nickel transport protein
MKKILLSLSISILFSLKSYAHYQMVYTPKSALESGANINLNIVFTHPFSGAYTMDMAGVEEFYVINRNKKKDIKKSLKETVYTDINSKGKGYALKYKARRMGDHVFILSPKPFYDETSKSYIQQITKTMVNVLGVPTDWDRELGLKAEIVPLTKPYAIWTGSNFTGIVKSKGKTVPYAKIEVKYLNRDFDTKTNTLEKPQIKAPQAAFTNMIIKANKDGEFNFTIPKEGFWGFKAMGVGSDKTYKGKKLEQDAVIWVQTTDMK